MRSHRILLDALPLGSCQLMQIFMQSRRTLSRSPSADAAVCVCVCMRVRMRMQNPGNVAQFAPQKDPKRLRSTRGQRIKVISKLLFKLEM